VRSVVEAEAQPIGLDQVFTARGGNRRWRWGSFHDVRLLSDLLWVLRVTTGSWPRGLPKSADVRRAGRGRPARTGPSRGEAAMAGRATSRHELADLMRQLRLPARTLDRLGTAAAGRWENAVEVLFIALRSRAALITARERAELRTVLGALNMLLMLAHSPGDKAPSRHLFGRKR
jgi:hypothetical protein